MPTNIEIISTLNIPDDVKNWILCMSSTFQEQFLVYYKSIGHTLEKSINRAMAETDEIHIETVCRINKIMNDNNMSDNEKLKSIKELIS